MGGVLTIGHLIIDSDNMLGGNSECTGGLGYEALDDSLGLEVLTLLVGGRHTELSGREVVAPSVVGGLLISYLH